MENGASRMTLYHGIGEKKESHFWFPFPMNLELERKASTKFGLILFHTDSYNPIHLSEFGMS